MRIWQQDEAGKNQVGQGENGGYLFDRVQQTDGTYTVNTAQGAAGAGGADIVYDIVNGGKADAVISGSAGQGKQDIGCHGNSHQAQHQDHVKAFVLIPPLCPVGFFHVNISFHFW